MLFLLCIIDTHNLDYQFVTQIKQTEFKAKAPCCDEDYL